MVFQDKDEKEFPLLNRAAVKTRASTMGNRGVAVIKWSYQSGYSANHLFIKMVAQQPKDKDKEI